MCVLYCSLACCRSTLKKSTVLCHASAGEAPQIPRLCQRDGTVHGTRSSASRAGHDGPTATYKLALEGLGVGPLSVEIRVVLVVLQLLLLLLLLVVVRQHGLVRVLVDPRLPHWRPRALGCQLGDDLRLLVPAHVLLQGLVRPQLLPCPPDVGLRVVEDLLQLRRPIELLLVLELHARGVVHRQSVVRRVGDHDRPAHVVDVRLARAAVEAPLLGHEVHVDGGLGLLGGAAEHVRDFGRRRAPGAEAVLVRVRGLPVGVDVELSDLAQVVRDAAGLLGPDRAVLCQLLARRSKPQDLQAQVVDFAQLLEEIRDAHLNGGLEKELVLLFRALHVQDHHGL
mmetsp:Transcript_39247/g.79273  ORF Transcript_39247/g.79273 Transcript_39247/m.79273 type:complete len:339 (+) Transcript_39247:71-1087(+)